MQYLKFKKKQATNIVIDNTRGPVIMFVIYYPQHTRRTISEIVQLTWEQIYSK